MNERERQALYQADVAAAKVLAGEVKLYEPGSWPRLLERFPGPEYAAVRAALHVAYEIGHSDGESEVETLQVEDLQEAVALLADEAFGEGVGLPDDRGDLQEVVNTAGRRFKPDAWWLPENAPLPKP